MTIISQREAKERKHSRFFTGQPCIHGHLAERYVSNGSCVTCQAKIMQRYYEANRERLRALKAEHYRANRKEIIRRQVQRRREKRAAARAAATNGGIKGGS